MAQLLNVSVSDGKYTVIQEADGRLHALRYGEPFNRSIVGDKLVLCLAQDLAQAREDLAEAKELISSLEQALAPKPHMVCKAQIHGSPETGWRLTKPATLEEAYENASHAHTETEHTMLNYHAQADNAARTPLFDPDKAVATFRKEIDMAVGTLLAKLNTKA